MKRFGLIIASIIGLSINAQADILLEPYLNYQMGSLKSEVTGASSKDALTGPNLGARVGGTYNMLFIGGDYSMSVGGKWKDDSGGNASGDATNSHLYGVIGADLPIVRLWAGYGLMNELKLKGQVSETTFSGGTHLKAGVGLKIFPLVSLNFEYLTGSYKKAKSGNNSISIPTTGSLQKVSHNGFNIGVSVPFNL